MSKTVFLSTVSKEFGDLRRRLARMLQRTQRVHVRHQDDFVLTGELRLEKLQREIEGSEVVLHAIGGVNGAIPPAEQVRETLANLEQFQARFPQVAARAEQGLPTYTQWEAWLALYFDKRLCIYQLSPRRVRSRGR